MSQDFGWILSAILFCSDFLSNSKSDSCLTCAADRATNPGNRSTFVAGTAALVLTPLTQDDSRRLQFKETSHLIQTNLLHTVKHEEVTPGQHHGLVTTL